MPKQPNQNQPGRDQKDITTPTGQPTQEVLLPKAKHAGGRPSKYKPELCQAIIEFFDIEPTYKQELPHYKNGEVAWKDYKLFANKLPTLLRFAKANDIGYQTIHDWINPKHASFHQEFSDAFMRAKELQKEFLIENGLNGTYNPLFAKFVAINITDMKDQPLIDQTTHYHVTYSYRQEPKKKEEQTNRVKEHA
jgi:hypothetical protein